MTCKDIVCSNLKALPNEKQQWLKLCIPSATMLVTPTHTVTVYTSVHLSVNFLTVGNPSKDPSLLGQELVLVQQLQERFHDRHAVESAISAVGSTSLALQSIRK